MAIEIKEACFTYPNGYQALSNIHLTVEEGECAAIVGQNGAGKTTCVKMMNGLNKPTSGEVLVDGINTKNVTTATVAKIVGYIFQNPDEQIFNRTAKAEIEHMLRYNKLSEEEIKKNVDRAVEMTEIGAYLDSNPYEIPFPIRKFVTIASVIATRPKYIIFDEPTAGQDARGNKILSNLIRDLHRDGIAVITITHDMEFVVDNFPRVIAMAHKNVIADGTAKEIFGNDAILKDAKIRRPVIAELARIKGIEGDVLTIDELVDKV